MNNFRVTPAGTLRINSSRSAASLLIAPLIRRFLSAYPDIHLELVDDDGFTDVVASGFDAGVRLEESIHEDMVAVRLGPPQRFAVVGTPDYFSQHGIPKHLQRSFSASLHSLPFPKREDFFAGSSKKTSTSFDLDVKGQLTLSDQQLMLGSVLDGIGLGYIFEGLAIDEIKAGRLVRRASRIGARPSRASCCTIHGSGECHRPCELSSTWPRPRGKRSLAGKAGTDKPRISRREVDRNRASRRGRFVGTKRRPTICVGRIASFEIAPQDVATRHPRHMHSQRHNENHHARPVQPRPAHPQTGRQLQGRHRCCAIAQGGRDRRTDIGGMVETASTRGGRPPPLRSACSNRG